MINTNKRFCLPGINPILAWICRSEEYTVSAGLQSPGRCITVHPFEKPVASLIYYGGNTFSKITYLILSMKPGILQILETRGAEMRIVMKLMREGLGGHHDKNVMLLTLRHGSTRSP